MTVHFPETCKLSSAEREVLCSILVEGDSPCDGCTWEATCDGPAADQRAADLIISDPDGHCLVCGGDVGRTFESKLVPGVFRFCTTTTDEYVFSPRGRADNPDQVAKTDDIEF